MNIHKRTKLTPQQREEIYRRHHTEHIRVALLAEEYHVSRPTIYKILARGRKRDFSIHNSCNARFRTLAWGMKRLAKIEKTIEARLKKEAKRYNKSYPGEMLHLDCKRLPLLKGQDHTTPRDYLFVAIDDYSRELYAAILPDKTAASAGSFLGQVLEECAYTIETAYTDNGKEFQGNPEHHAFAELCMRNGIGQKFTRPATPKTNGKAERVIRTLMEMWHDKEHFESPELRRKSLARFVNYYNWVKPHKSLGHLTPGEKLCLYFFSQDFVNNP